MSTCGRAEGHSTPRGSASFAMPRMARLVFWPVGVSDARNAMASRRAVRNNFFILIFALGIDFGSSL
jgi:hypothetical protein